MQAASILAASLSEMDIVHEHNLIEPLDMPKPFGIRVSLPATDTFARVIGAGWERYHWYHTREERDRALADMAGEHLYSRHGDKPTVRFEPVERGTNETST
jgi:hypothetical protein